MFNIIIQEVGATPLLALTQRGTGGGDGSVKGSAALRLTRPHENWGDCRLKNIAPHNSVVDTHTQQAFASSLDLKLLLLPWNRETVEIQAPLRWLS